MNKLKILYSEDSMTDAELVLRALKKEGYDSDCVVTADLAEIERLLAEKTFDVVLSDYNMQKFNALDVLKKRNTLAPGTPFIVVTGTLSDEVAVELLKQGATDYILKDRISRLCPAIDRALKDRAEKNLLEAAQAEVRENEARYRELFESSSELIFLVSLTGFISAMNPAFCALLGKKPGSFRAEALVPEDRLQNFREALGAAAAGISPRRLETVFLSGDGKRFEVEGSFFPRTKNGQVLYIQAIFHDLTEQRSLEAQFRQAQKMEAVGRLAGGIAHDFNNILGAVEGYATLTLNSLKQDDPIRPDIEEIRKAVARAAALTRQLLIFSRKNALQKKICTAGDIIVNLQSMLKRIIGENIKLELELQPALPAMKADAPQIEQLLVNLLVNARDAMPGGGRIKLGAHAKTLERHEIKSPSVPETRGEFIILSVKDEGQGMSPETLEHIFEPFFTTKEKGKGTGLGLATVYGVVKQHNGWLEVTSAPGHGAEFKVFLPACPDEEKPREAEKSAPAAASPTAARILIIEDDDALRNLANKALREAGHATETARGAVEGLDIFRARNGKFDIVFSDLVLGDRKIIEIIDDFLAINPGASFIFTSGYLDDKTNLDLISSRGFRFIPKPYALDALQKAIQEALKK